MGRNKFGLTRHIPEEVKKAVRMNSKFACVVPFCRNIIYEYEHLLPEFKDADEHNSENICLVCPTHHPRKAGKNGEELYSKEQLTSYYNAIQKCDAPIGIRNRSLFSGFNNNVKVKLGGLLCENISSLIEIDGKDIFSFQLSKEVYPFAPEVVFNGDFKKPSGDPLFKIVNNEWISDSDHGDVTYKNGILEIYNNDGEKIFALRKFPEQNLLVIDKLILWSYPFQVVVQDNDLSIFRHDFSTSSYLKVSINAMVSSQNNAILLSSAKGPDLDFNSGPIYNGNRGFSLGNNGIGLASGKGVSRISKIHIEYCNFGRKKLLKFIDVRDLK